jgi:hypothetical protein
MSYNVLIYTTFKQHQLCVAIVRKGKKPRVRKYRFLIPSRSIGVHRRCQVLCAGDRHGSGVGAYGPEYREDDDLWGDSEHLVQAGGQEAGRVVIRGSQ